MKWMFDLVLLLVVVEVLLLIRIMGNDWEIISASRLDFILKCTNGSVVATYQGLLALPGCLGESPA